MTESLCKVWSVVFLFCSITACVRSSPQGIPPSRWLSQDFALIRGVVICSDCRLEDARSRYPDMDGLYEFAAGEERLVFRVDWVNDAVRWRQVTFGNRLSVRGNPGVFQFLTNPEHRLQPMELNVILRDERVMDIGTVSFLKQ